MNDIPRLTNHRWIHLDSQASINESMVPVNFAVVEENAHAVIVAAIRAEDLFIKVIDSFMHCVDAERQNFLHRELLQTSWCTFVIKRDLVLSIVKQRNLVSGKEFDAFRKQIEKLNRYRNAFAHGRYAMRHGKPHINYYSGGEKSEELTNEFWSALDADITRLMTTLLTVWAHFRDAHRMKPEV